MKIFCNILSTVFLFCFISACSSSEKALENKRYLKAMNLASKQIKKGNNIDENTIYLQSAAQGLVNKTLDSYQNENASNVKDWKRSRTKFYSVLKQLNNKNIKTNGLISQSYDRLCEAKQELDLRIVNYYYDEGIKLLNKSKSTNETQWAREAYHEFQLSEKEGASAFYGNLLDLKEECIQYGSIFVDAPSELRLNNKFLKSIADHEGAIADCTIKIGSSSVTFSESFNETQEEKTKEIKVGENAITDTSGVTTYEDILEEVIGFKNTNEITFSANQQIYITVTPNNSECFLDNRTLNLEASEKCTEIKYTGDKSVFTSSIDQTCSKFNIEMNLKQDLRREHSNNLYID